MEDFEQARTRMVIAQVQPNDVSDPRLLAALLEIPRERFVPASRRAIAYIDEDVLLKPADGRNPARYLMEPMPFAKLVQLADILPADLVLDIGCGTGYSSAVLSRLADSVVALECDEELAAAANETLPELEIGNVAVVTGPLNQGYPEEGPYDAIVLNGAVSQVPEALFEQLKEGGRLVAILVEEGRSQAWLFTRHGGRATGRPASNASAKPLPGFAREEGFVF
ncbi:MAG: protein-L-isoaspartate O-methyltransferase [Hyphomicrobiales bacterium]|nr:protein-L-isoaspartate O-methyltransferase [Hyphomicrobiales bacterium]